MPRRLKLIAGHPVRMLGDRFPQGSIKQIVRKAPAILQATWRMSNIKQLTGNIGLYHVARELSLVGWNVMPTVRNARGADLYACSEDERTIHPIQVKAHSIKPQDTPLGLHPERLVTPWWAIVTFARTSDISCYLISLDEIRQRMRRDPGTRSLKSELERVFWLNRRFYTSGSEQEMIEARNAWHRLGTPRSFE